MRIRSGYGFRTSYGFLEDVMERIETPYAPLTDDASGYGWNQWRKLCKKVGKKPIYGIELAVTPSMHSKVMNMSKVTLIATTDLAPLNRITELAFSQFRFEPVISYEQLNNLDKSIAVILGRRIDTTKLNLLRKWYLADSPSTPGIMYEYAEKHGWELIASSDNLYPAPEDRHAFQLTLGRSASIQTWPQHILTEDELAAYCRPGSMENRDRLAEKCTADLPRGEMAIPDRSVSIEQWCISGAKELGVNLDDPVYMERLKRELTVIRKKEFDDYFIIIADMIRFARNEGIMVGPGRGSSAGSLVCYLMGITQVDPILHDTLFERFLDVGRGGWHFA